MRIGWAWVLLAMGILGGTSATLLYLHHTAAQKEVLREEIRTGRLAFQRTHSPRLSLGLSDWSAHPELLKSETTLPQFHRYPIAVLRALQDPSCKAVASGSSQALDKARRWRRFLCGKGALPAAFFSTAPFMHFGGKSFAQLARDSGRAPFHTPAWLSAHLPFFHVLERKALPGQGLEFLDYALLEGLNHSQTTLLGNSVIALAALSGAKAPTGLFHFYDRRVWDEDLRRRGFIVDSHCTSKDCLAVDGSVCWSFHPDRRVLENLSLAGLVLSGLALVSTAVFLIWDRKRTALRAREARHFLLQTLTHELRTPVTTLQLTVEAFRRDFDSLNPNGQKNFMRLADEVQRLSRLVHTSVKYLRGDSQELRFEPQTLPSINQLVETWLAPYAEALHLQLLQADRPVHVDPYWLGLCLTNLVENAFRHGRAPVEVKIVAAERGVHILVEDAGTPAVKTLGDFMTPKAYQPAAGGLGMGLSLVKKVMETMGGKLSFAANPTRFMLLLKDV